MTIRIAPKITSRIAGAFHTDVTEEVKSNIISLFKFWRG
jgi:hypothetical protein